MKVFEVGYKVADGILSVNMIEAAHVCGHELEAVTETAERHAAHYQETVSYISEISDRKAAENRRRGMPYYTIDSEAREKYGTSEI